MSLDKEKEKEKYQAILFVATIAFLITLGFYALTILMSWLIRNVC
jgi:uncharacterized membrane protein YqjE